MDESVVGKRRKMSPGPISRDFEGDSFLAELENELQALPALNTPASSATTNGMDASQPSSFQFSNGPTMNGTANGPSVGPPNGNCAPAPVSSVPSAGGYQMIGASNGGPPISTSNMSTSSSSVLQGLLLNNTGPGSAGTDVSGNYGGGGGGGPRSVPCPASTASPQRPPTAPGMHPHMSQQQYVRSPAAAGSGLMSPPTQMGQPPRPQMGQLPIQSIRPQMAQQTNGMMPMTGGPQMFGPNDQVAVSMPHGNAPFTQPNMMVVGSAGPPNGQMYQQYAGGQPRYPPRPPINRPGPPMAANGPNRMPPNIGRGQMVHPSMVSGGQGQPPMNRGVRHQLGQMPGHHFQNEGQFGGGGGPPQVNGPSSGPMVGRGQPPMNQGPGASVSIDHPYGPGSSLAMQQQAGPSQPQQHPNSMGSPSFVQPGQPPMPNRPSYMNPNMPSSDMPSIPPSVRPPMGLQQQPLSQPPQSAGGLHPGGGITINGGGPSLSAPSSAASNSFVPSDPRPHPNMTNAGMNSSLGNLSSSNATTSGAPSIPPQQHFEGRATLPPSDGGGGGSGGGGGGMPHNQDPEKRKLIQQQLVLLLHAHRCQQRERDQGMNGNNQRTPCQLAHCSTMKDVLSHMTSCQSGRDCLYTHCASSRQIISHWKNCTRSDCPVCEPLKRLPAINNRTDNNGRPQGPVGANGGPPENSLGYAADMERLIGGPAAMTSYPKGDGSIPGSVPPNVQVSAPGSASSSELVLPPPEAASVVKLWHKSVTNDLRNHLVSKLVKAIFPSPDPSSMQDQRIRDLIQYAKKVEKEMFEMASDREEYYHLLAEKIYKIQKELQEKKQRRLQEQAAQHQAPSSLLSGAGGGMQGGLQSLDSIPPPNRTVTSREPPAAPYDAPPDPFRPIRPGGGPNVQPGSGKPGFLRTNSTSQVDNSTTSIKTETDGPSAKRIKTEPSLVVKREMDSGSSAAGDTADVKPGSDVKPPVKLEVASTSGGAASDMPVRPKHFFPDSLRAMLKPVWAKIDRMEEAIPFRVPVDPDLLNIPDYFEIVKRPMDMMTISEKLDQGEYKDPWEFCDDIYQMFDNAWLYNRKNSKVYKFCTKISDVFMDEIDPVMRKAGYCCGRRLPFTPLPIFCYGQPMCTIQRDQPYHLYEKISNAFNVTVSEKYTYCGRCYEQLPEQGINLSDDPANPNWIPKDQFKPTKNDQIEYEPFEHCRICRRKWHRICALYSDKIYPEGFICSTCRTEIKKPVSENKYLAKRLPHCHLSRHIENRVNGYLQKRVSAVAGEVIIRILSSSDKQVDVKCGMRNKFCAPNGDFPEKFPYRSKAIFAFEVIDGSEVCFFGLHVQEYGSNSPRPNTRRVYIAYLDSVHFFQPREERTNVYHQILLGYLEYVKTLGYTMAHIWACPPQEGDDYVFHCHPPEQRIPKQKRLQEWYKKMLDRGIIERTVTDYKDIYKQAIDDKMKECTELPYFEGDFWPGVLEDCIRDVEKAEAERRRLQEAEDAAAASGTLTPAICGADEEIDDDNYEVGGSQGKKKSNPKSNKKKNIKNKGNQKKKKLGGATGNELTDKLYTAMEKHKEVFFTIRLTTAQTESTLPEINDPDPLIPSELMDGRDTFLAKARDEHWEFSSLRRAKYSTMCLTHALHQQGKDIIYTCNGCQRNNARWHCNTCDDFDLCNDCNKTVTHPHKLDENCTLVDNDSSAQSGDAKAQDQNRNESIQRCIQSLVHACQCRDANCRRLSCHKMKRVVQHTRACRKRQGGNCPVCKQLIALCCYHAKHCLDAHCQVPFCQNIRQKLNEQKQVQRRRDDFMMRRRMQGVGMAGAPVPVGPPPGAMPPNCAPGGVVPVMIAQGPFGSGPPGPPQVQQSQPQGAQMMPHQSPGGPVPMHPRAQMINPQQQHPMRMPIGNFNHAQSQQQLPPHQMQAGGPPMHPAQQQRMMGNRQMPQQPMNPPPYTRPGMGPPGAGQQLRQQMRPQMNQQQWNDVNGPPRMGGVPLRPPVDAIGNNDHKNAVNQILQRFKASRNDEETQQIMAQLKQKPEVFNSFLRMTKQQNAGNMQQQSQELQQQQQQQQWQNQQRMNDGGQQLPPGGFYAGGGGQQGRPPPAYASGGYNPMAGGGGRVGPPMSPHAPSPVAQQTLLNQVRSPPVGHSPATPSPMMMNQSPAQPPPDQQQTAFR